MAINPTGSQYPGVIGTTDPNNPVGSPGNYNAGNSQNPTTPPTATNYNPFQVPLPGLMPTMNPGGATGTGGTTGTTTLKDNNGNTLTTSNAFGQAGNQEQWNLQELQNQFGTGVGSMIFQYLQSGGGYNSPLATQTVDATNQAMLQNITLGAGNLSTNLSASGISPNSSTSALELSNYESNAMTQMNAIDAQIYNQMYESGQNREAGMLSEVAQEAATHTANQGGWIQQFEDMLGIAQQGAGTASGLISAFSPGANTDWLDAIAGA